MGRGRNRGRVIRVHRCWTTGKRILGALTGGVSECSSPKGPDLYSSLYKAWNVTGSLGNPNSLKSYLDPVNLAGPAD